MSRHVSSRRIAATVLLLGPAPALWAAGTNAVSASAGLPEIGGSLVRMIAGLAFVLALFFGGVWAFKNWQRVTRVRRHQQLSICEVRALGPRQALYVIGYERQRFLVAASPAGIALVSALPEAASSEPAAPAAGHNGMSFAQVLQNVLGRK